MRLGTQRPGVSHYSYIAPGAQLLFGRDWRHHELTQTRPGARMCGICGRWVVRGLGRWWER
jgi:hypothetical protein